MNLASSYSRCDRLARRAAGNFYHAFRLLPRPQRLSTSALYAFCRRSDDICDGPGPVLGKAEALASWREQLRQALRGRYSHWLHPALHHTVESYQVPSQYLEDILDGVAMDLEPVKFNTFAELYPYCYRVASAVGLACIHVWGFASEQAKPLAESAGVAFQLTNILRDLREDAMRGRVYLPHDELERFGCTSQGLADGICDAPFRALMRFQVDRARQYYEQGWLLTAHLRPSGRACSRSCCGPTADCCASWRNEITMSLAPE